MKCALRILTADATSAPDVLRAGHWRSRAHVSWYRLLQWGSAITAFVCGLTAGCKGKMPRSFDSHDRLEPLPFDPSMDADAPVPLDDAKSLEERKALVAAIARFDTFETSVLQALGTVPRHLFVPKSLRDHAYDDGPLAIGLDQTISQPTVVAMMTQALKLRGNEHVLEVGTGSGYQAAVLSRLCKQVDSIELLTPLAERAREVLARLHYDNVRVHIGDGYKGLAEKAPFDAIIVTAAPPEIPDALVAQLRDPGRLVVPVGPSREVQALLLISKQDGQVHRHNLGAVRFVPMIHGASPTPN